MNILYMFQTWFQCISIISLMSFHLTGLHYQSEISSQLIIVATFILIYITIIYFNYNLIKWFPSVFQTFFVWISLILSSSIFLTLPTLHLLSYPHFPLIFFYHVYPNTPISRDLSCSFTTQSSFYFSCFCS